MNPEHGLCPARVSGECRSILGNGLAHAGFDRRFPLVPGAVILRALRDSEWHARDKNHNLALLHFYRGILDVAARVRARLLTNVVIFEPENFSMPKLFRSVLAFAALAVGLPGCSKSEEARQPAPPPSSGEDLSEVTLHVPGMT
jgi:hypothetical protein